MSMNQCSLLISDTNTIINTNTNTYTYTYTCMNIYYCCSFRYIFCTLKAGACDYGEYGEYLIPTCIALFIYCILIFFLDSIPNFVQFFLWNILQIHTVIVDIID